MFYDVTMMNVQKWRTETEGKEVELATQYIIVGEKVAALSVKSNGFISQWYSVPEAAPHITLLVNSQAKLKDLGPMMKNDEEQTGKQQTIW